MSDDPNNLRFLTCDLSRDWKTPYVERRPAMEFLDRVIVPQEEFESLRAALLRRGLYLRAEGHSYALGENEYEILQHVDALDAKRRREK